LPGLCRSWTRLRDLVALAFFSFVRLLLGLRLLERARFLLLVRSIRLAVAGLAPVVLLASFLDL
jgi:hypothetical protein